MIGALVQLATTGLVVMPVTLQVDFEGRLALSVRDESDRFVRVIKPLTIPASAPASIAVLWLAIACVVLK